MKVFALVPHKAELSVRLVSSSLFDQNENKISVDVSVSLVGGTYSINICERSESVSSQKKNQQLAGSVDSNFGHNSISKTKIMFGSNEATHI